MHGGKKGIALMVHFLLVSADDHALEMWQMSVGARLMLQERRGQTIYYTCMDEDLDFAKETADTLKVTLQEVKAKDGCEEYPVLVQGCDLSWPAPE